MEGKQNAKEKAQAAAKAALGGGKSSGSTSSFFQKTSSSAFGKPSFGFGAPTQSSNVDPSSIAAYPALPSRADDISVPSKPDNLGSKNVFASVNLSKGKNKGKGFSFGAPACTFATGISAAGALKHVAYPRLPSNEASISASAVPAQSSLGSSNELVCEKLFKKEVNPSDSASKEGGAGKFGA